MEKPVYIDMSKYKRLKHFEYFKSLAQPYVGTTCDVDITAFYDWYKKNKYPFFLSFLWCISQAANQVAEFRQRIESDKIVEFLFCNTSHTVAKEDGTYSYCRLNGKMKFHEFIEYAGIQQEEARLNGDIEETETQSLFFISTLPELTYGALVQPTPFPADSNPRITWGKFYARENHIYMPVSVLCNHALVDGKHIAQFYQFLDSVITKTINEK